jgi:hypothetical protein
MEQESQLRGYWASAEMNGIMEDALRLQQTSMSIFDAIDGGDMGGGLEEHSALEAAALHVAFEQMREAVRRSRPLPGREELLVGVARTLMKTDFAEAQQVVAAVTSVLARGG